MDRAIPLLRFYDEPATRAFYLDWLGFEVLFDHRFEPELPLYMGIRRDAVVLHLTGHHGDCTPGSAVFIEMADVDTYRAELLTRPYAFYRPAVETVPWGFRQMIILDPAGNRLLFNTAL